MAALGLWRRVCGAAALAVVGAVTSVATAGVAVAAPGVGAKAPAGPASAPARAKASGDNPMSGEWVGFADVDGEGELLKAKVDETGTSIRLDVLGLRDSGGANWTLPGASLPAQARDRFATPGPAELMADGKLKVSLSHNGRRLTGLLQRVGEADGTRYAKPRTWPLDKPDDQKVYLSFQLAIKKAQNYTSVDALPKTDAAVPVPAATSPAGDFPVASRPTSASAGEPDEPVVLLRPMKDDVLEPRGSKGRFIWAEIGCMIVPGKRVDYWNPPQRVIEIVQNGKSYPTALAKTFDTRERLQKLSFSWARPEGKDLTGPCEAYIYLREPKAPFRIISNIIKVRAKFVARRDQAAGE